MVASIRSLHLVSKTEHDAGQSTYAVKLVQSIHALNKLDSGNQSSIRARKQRELRDKKRAEKVKNMTALGGTVTGLGMCLLGWGTNRRRQITKNMPEKYLPIGKYR